VVRWWSNRDGQRRGQRNGQRDGGAIAMSNGGGDGRRRVSQLEMATAVTRWQWATMVAAPWPAGRRCNHDGDGDGDCDVDGEGEGKGDGDSNGDSNSDDGNGDGDGDDGDSNSEGDGDSNGEGDGNGGGDGNGNGNGNGNGLSRCLSMRHPLICPGWLSRHLAAATASQRAVSMPPLHSSRHPLVYPAWLSRHPSSRHHLSTRWLVVQCLSSCHPHV
jgi:hypothetical protein